MMTIKTNRNKVKPMFRGVAFVVMIMFCGFTTNTLQSIRADQFTGSNSVIDSIDSFNPFGVLLTIFLCVLAVCDFAFIGLAILLRTFALCGSAFFGLSIGLLARFALAMKSLSFGFIFVKFQKRLNFFARRTLFVYDLLRHNFLLGRKLCLEPLQIRYLCGLFYYSGVKLIVK